MLQQAIRFFYLYSNIGCYNSVTLLYKLLDIQHSRKAILYCNTIELYQLEKYFQELDSIIGLVDKEQKEGADKDIYIEGDLQYAFILEYIELTKAEEVVFNIEDLLKFA